MDKAHGYDPAAERSPAADRVGPSARYLHADLVAFADALLQAAGLAPEIARVMAMRIVDADLHGHDTHGVALLPRYLRELTSGLMATGGTIRTLSDRGASLLWDACLLPGHWVMEQAMATAIARAKQHGSATLAVRRSHHLGALQVYLPTATQAGCLCIIWAADTQDRTVAPFGGLDPVLSSEPIAFGIPTSGEPILIDTTTSLSSNAEVKRAKARGERMRGPVLLDAEGRATDDPQVFGGEPPGTILPLGGLSHGYKGYALALAVSTMALALPGWGRMTGEKTQGFVLQMLDPEAFGGREAFVRETDWMVATSRRARTPRGGPPVRLPGDGARAYARRGMAEGIPVAADVVETIAPWAEKLAVALPSPIAPAASAAHKNGGPI